MRKAPGWWLREGRRERFIASYEFPVGLQAKLRSAWPELDERGAHLAVEGLRDWFRICCASQPVTLVAMPSRAADEAWHEFILFTRDYTGFCDKAYRHYLHHSPAEVAGVADRMERGLNTAWAVACALEAIDRQRPDRLPRIFALDERLRLQDGMRWRLPEAGADAGPVRLRRGLWRRRRLKESGDRRRRRVLRGDRLPELPPPPARARGGSPRSPRTNTCSAVCYNSARLRGDSGRAEVRACR